MSALIEKLKTARALSLNVVGYVQPLSWSLTTYFVLLRDGDDDPDHPFPADLASFFELASRWRDTFDSDVLLALRTTPDNEYKSTADDLVVQHIHLVKMPIFDTWQKQRDPGGVLPDLGLNMQVWNTIENKLSAAQAIHDAICEVPIENFGKARQQIELEFNRAIAWAVANPAVVENVNESDELSRVLFWVLKNEINAILYVLSSAVRIDSASDGVEAITQLNEHRFRCEQIAQNLPESEFRRQMFAVLYFLDFNQCEPFDVARSKARSDESGSIKICRTLLDSANLQCDQTLKQLGSQCNAETTNEPQSRGARALVAVLSISSCWELDFLIKQYISDPEMSAYNVDGSPRFDSGQTDVIGISMDGETPSTIADTLPSDEAASAAVEFLNANPDNRWPEAESTYGVCRRTINRYAEKHGIVIIERKKGRKKKAGNAGK